MKIKDLVLIIYGLFLLAGCVEDSVPVNSVPVDSTAASNVVVLEQKFTIPVLNRQRKVRIYLPPNYEVAAKKYPVLYMHDAQNLFDVRTSFMGEWGVDEVLNRLSSEKNLNLIVVGIDNGEEHRMTELNPWDNADYGVAEGKQYMNFIVSVLKPYIDSHYRTLPDQPNTGLMGSSMGGLISHYGIFKYPEVFSKAGIFSPSFTYADEVYLFSDPKKLSPNSRLYFLMGGAEGEEAIEHMQRMTNQLLNIGFRNQAILKSKVVEGGEHNEGFWRAEFAEAVLWMYAK